ncbi:hypothetical protein HK105_201471 [Polyrhizophydium stewartii]|uniref:Yip1 domain-containing protein n=1 Tax=Polyrhizophydium stewartii TaxID=2732419 RepID=A0ABR4NI62_9FUNG|nr:hypothetical protein HK105_006921 [Polyrhizophydium stewartii]
MESALLLLAHPDLFLADVVRAFWQLIHSATALLLNTAPKPVADWLSKMPEQAVALLIGGLILYFTLFVLSALLRGVLRSIAFLVKTVVVCVVLLAALYVAQVYVLPSAGSRSHSK